MKPPPDPGFAALRRAARAAIVIPLAFAFGMLVLHDVQNIIFIVFGCFALLIVSDFGGPRPARALAYLTFTAVAAVFVALGTAVSLNPLVAATVTLVVALVISFTRVFGGYIAAAQTGMLLAFVVAVSIPAPPTAIPGRLGGLLIAGILSTIAAVTLWPRFEHITLHKKAARACLAVADLVDCYDPSEANPDLARMRKAAREAEQEARREYTATAKRPAGPSRRDRAFVQLLTELQRIVDVIERPFHQQRPLARPQLVESDRLKQSVVNALRGSADVLTGGTPPDVRTVDQARQAHRSALDRWAAEALRGGQPAEQVLDGLDADHTLRVISYLTIALARNAIIAAGRRPDHEFSGITSTPPPDDEAPTLARLLSTVRTHLDPSSTLLHGSLRVAAALAVAVLVADSLGLQRGFWVVLGAMQVLRSNALGTGRTMVEALVGNLVGVVLGGLFAAVTGANPVLLSAALPFAFFIAAYASTAVGFAASQAAFSVLLIIVFNLITPAGWRVGLVRFEDVAIGALIGAAIGLTLWPRGVRRDLGRAFAGFYQAAALYLDHAFDQMLGWQPPAKIDPARRTALLAQERAGEAFDAFVNEKAASPLSPETAGFLLSAGNHILLGADLLEILAGMGYQAQTCPQGADTVGGQVHIVVETLDGYADRLALAGSASSWPGVSEGRLREAAVDCLRRWRNSDQVGRGALAVVMASEWVLNLGRLETDLEQPINSAVQAARIPWWR
ncbi:MAG TPA: FUSC family protein [Candidatus Dormibacteraeota bacterium]|jgi:uncharacterized membrane protein YccC|nr:FUSC family protein [Candidatus Dormibacteraeota bacterium]